MGKIRVFLRQILSLSVVSFLLILPADPANADYGSNDYGESPYHAPDPYYQSLNAYSLYTDPAADSIYVRNHDSRMETIRRMNSGEERSLRDFYIMLAVFTSGGIILWWTRKHQSQ